LVNASPFSTFVHTHPTQEHEARGKPVKRAILCVALVASTTIKPAAVSERVGLQAAAPPDARAKMRIAEAFGNQPLGFEVNAGQTDAAVQFVSRGIGYTLFLTPTEAVMNLSGPPDRRAADRQAQSASQGAPSSVLRMKLVGSNPAPRVSQRDRLPGSVNYVVGADRKKWHTQIPRFGKVEYEDVYPGVNLVYYGNQRQLEYDFVVEPGADVDSIELAFDGAGTLRVNDAGDLLLDASHGALRFKAPVIYQETDRGRTAVSGGYRLTAANRVAFHVDTYDSTKRLVIDPILLYSTYLGGSSADFALGVAMGPDGSAYVTGWATSVDFPTAGALQPACASLSCDDAFITKIGPSSFSTYFGGTSSDVATGIALRPETGEIYIAGWTRSPDFPIVNAIDPVFGDVPSRERAFVAKLGSNGSELLYSTYLGGDEPIVHANAIAVDSDGAAYVTGSAGYYGRWEAFVTKLVPDGSSVAYSYRLGAPATGYGIAVDAQGYASVTGAAWPGFPIVNASQPTSGQGFAAKLFPDGSALVYSRYLYGNGIGTGIALAGPNAYITGAMPGPSQCCDSFSRVGPGGGPTDAFVEVLGFTGQSVNFTHLGGTGEDRGSQIGVDWSGNIWVTGLTTSTDFPLVNPLQGRVRELDAFVVRFNPSLEPVFATYLGGSGREQLDLGMPWPPGPALAADHFALAMQFGPGYPGHPPGLVYVAGFTDSTDFPAGRFGPAMQSTANGPVNGFVALVLDDGIPVKPDLVVTEKGRALGGAPPEAELGATWYYLFQVTNKGPARVKDATFFDKLPPGVVVDGVYPEPSSVYPRTCTHDDRWVFCDMGPLSEGESAMIPISMTPTTVGSQINTAAVIEAPHSECPTCISTAFINWINGFTEDLIWGEDAARDQDIKDNLVATTTLVTPGSADLSVTGLASSDFVMLHGTLTYTFDVENHGPATTTAATLTDTLPAGTTLISVTQAGSFGSCTGTNVITCQWSALSGLAQVTIAVRAGAPGTLTNMAVVSGTASDPDASNNTATVTTRVNRAPIANAGPDQSVTVGSNCQATVTLNGTASSDPDGDTLTYMWTSDNFLPPPILLSNGPGGSMTGATVTGPLPPGTHTLNLTVDDGHGGTATDTVVVTVRDVTPPAFNGIPAPATVEQSGPSGASFTVPLPIAVDNCSGSVAVSSDAPSVFPPGTTTVTFAAVDTAGNRATATTTVTVVDTVAPALLVASPVARDYQHTDALTLMFSATDGGSGLAAGNPSAKLDGTTVASGQTLQLLTLTLGTHDFTASARDAAGNSVSTAVTFQIVASIDSLIAAVNVYAAQGAISDANTAQSLLAKLNEAKQAAQRGNKSSATGKLQDFIDQVRARTGSRIAPGAAQILIGDAQYVIASLK
jgi:uncharacterized repeat protein (TIGR01451 family)